jgi:hypothetical protein
MATAAHNRRQKIAKTMRSAFIIPRNSDGNAHIPKEDTRAEIHFDPCVDEAIESGERGARGRSGNVESDFRGYGRCEKRRALTGRFGGGQRGWRHADEHKRRSKLSVVNRTGLPLGGRVAQIHIAVGSLAGDAVHGAQARGAAIGSRGGKTDGLGGEIGRGQGQDGDDGKESSRHACVVLCVTLRIIIGVRLLVILRVGLRIGAPSA